MGFKKGYTPWNKGKKGLLSEETLNKMSISRKGKKRPPFSSEWKKRIGLGSLGKKISEETKRKISKTMTGRTLTDEHKKNLSKSLVGKNTWTKGFHFKKEYVEKRSGKNSHLWKGGVTPINQLIRSRTEYKLWREAIFARDNFTCQCCKKAGGYLNAHHIFNFSSHTDLRFAIDNGITLCKKCHKNFHDKFGRKNNTKEQLIEFLK